jgi:hypothetical protein
MERMAMATSTVRSGDEWLAAALARGAAGAICLAAAPTFAVMALLSCLPGGNPYEPVCSVMRHVTPMQGMAWMYLLMSAFHLPPWLRLLTAR